MTELREVLKEKKSRAENLCSILIEIKDKFRKLEDTDKLNLPKFNKRFDEKSLVEYLERLRQAVKNPIIFRRRGTLVNLGISNIKNLKDEVFDNDDIDETIQLLKEIQTYDRLFKILSSELSSWFLQNTVKWINSRLKNIRNHIEKLRIIEEIRSESVKNYILREYLREKLDIYQINEFKNKVLKIEETLKLKIKESEVSLIDDIYRLIEDVEEFGEELEKQYINLSDAKNKLEKIKEDLKQQYERIKDEINFWQKLCPERYIPESRNISILKSELEEIKNICREKHKAFKVLEQIYSLGLHKKVTENWEDFTQKLDKLIVFLPDIKAENEEDINIIKNIYDQLSWLEKIEYPQIEKIFKGLTFKNAKSFFNDVEEIRKEYEYLRHDLNIYQRILRIREEQIDKYILLKQKIREYREDLKKRIGRGFESLIRYLKGETEDIEADEETLKNFIKTIKPLLKEVLSI